MKAQFTKVRFYQQLRNLFFFVPIKKVFFNSNQVRVALPSKKVGAQCTLTSLKFVYGMVPISRNRVKEQKLRRKSNSATTTYPDIPPTLRSMYDVR